MKPTEITVNYKRPDTASNMKKITSSLDACVIFKSIWSDQIEYREESYLLLVNRANKLLGYLKLSEGGITETIIDLKMVLQTALKCNAQAFIIAHSHPSGNLRPSTADISLTKKLKEAGKLLELELLDHLIITAEGYFSFADEGLI